MSLKITDLPQVDQGTVTDHISIPVSKSETDPKTYKMPLSQLTTYLTGKGFGGGVGAQGPQGFSGFSGLNGTNGANGTSLTKGMSLGITPLTFTFNNSNTAYGTTTANITANLQNLTATSSNKVVFSFQKYDSSGSTIGSVTTVNGSGSGYNTTTYTASTFGTSTAYVSISAVFTDTSGTYTALGQITRLSDGAAALTGILTIPAVVLLAGSDGSVPDPSSYATGAMKVYLGSTLLTSGITFSKVSDSTGLSTTIDSSTGAYTVVSLATANDTAKAVYQAATSYGTVTATLYLSKSKQGSSGTAKSIVVTASTNVIKFSSAGAATPTTTTFNILKNNIVTTVGGATMIVTATAYDASNNPTDVTSSLTTVSAGVTYTLPSSVFTSNPTAVLVVFNAHILDDNGTTYSNSQALAKVVDGSTTSTGTLTTDAATVDCASNGDPTLSPLSTISGVFRVYYGSTDISSSCTFSYTTVGNGGSGTGTQPTWALTTTTAGDGSWQYALATVGTTNTVQFVMTASYTIAGVSLTTTKIFTVSKTIKGPTGDTGPGTVYQGVFSSGRTYFCNSSRKDIVLWPATSPNAYYIANNTSLDGQAGSTYGTPNGTTNTNWKPFGATFDSVATNILLTDNANILHYLNMGGYNDGNTPTTAIRSYSTNVTGTPDAEYSGSNISGEIPTVNWASGTQGLANLTFGGNGFYMGYPSTSLAGAVPVFYVGNSSSNGANGSYILWDGSLFTVSGSINIKPGTGAGIFSGKSSYSDTNTGFWLGTDTDSTPKFAIGSTSKYLKWNGTNLQIAGGETVDGIQVNTQIGMHYIDDGTSGHPLTITGGSTNGVNHGAQIDLSGNSLTGFQGLLSLNSGNSSSGYIRFATGNAGANSGSYYNYDRLHIEYDGTVRIVKASATGYSGDVGIGAGAGNLVVDGSITLGGVARSSWPSGGGGGVTSITAGNGLTGGTITSSGTIAFDTSYAPTFAGLSINTYTAKFYNGVSAQGSGNSTYYNEIHLASGTIDGGGTVNSYLYPNGNATFGGSVTTGALTSSSATINGAASITGNATLGTNTSNTLTVNSAATFGGNLTVQGYLVAGPTAAFGGGTYQGIQVNGQVAAYKNSDYTIQTGTGSYSSPGTINFKVDYNGNVTSTSLNTGSITGLNSITLGGTAITSWSSLVTGVYGGTGVSVSSNTGNVTVNIGQSVSSSSSPTFAGLTLNTYTAAFNNGFSSSGSGNSTFYNEVHMAVGGTVNTNIYPNGNATFGGTVTAGSLKLGGTTISNWSSIYNQSLNTGDSPTFNNLNVSFITSSGTATFNNGFSSSGGGNSTFYNDIHMAVGGTVKSTIAAGGNATFAGLVTVQGGSSGSGGLIVQANGGSTRVYIDNVGNMEAGGFITADVQMNSPLFNVTSSRRWKTNIAPLTGALNMVSKLQGVTFDWNTKSVKNDFGLIAEDVQEVLPTIVGTDKDGLVSGLDYSRLTAVLIEAVKELNAKIAVLEAKVNG